MKDKEPVLYKDYENLENDFRDGKIHPGDLKDSSIAVLNRVSAESTFGVFATLSHSLSHFSLPHSY